MEPSSVKYIHKSYDIDNRVTNFVYDNEIVYSLSDHELRGRRWQEVTRNIEGVLKLMLEEDGHAVANPV